MSQHNQTKCEYPGCQGGVFIECPESKKLLCYEHKDIQKSFFTNLEAEMSCEGDDVDDGSYIPSGTDTSQWYEDSSEDSERNNDFKVIDQQQFLAQFQPPKKSDRANARKIRPVKVTERKGKNKNSLPKVSAKDRVKMFAPLEPVVCKDCNIYYTACHLILSKKLSTLKNHFKSSAHISKKDAINGSKERNERVQAIINMSIPTLQASTDTHATIVRTPNNVAFKEHLIEVCYALLVEGIPFTVLSTPNSELRRLLEVGRGKLPRRDVSDMVPAVLKGELKPIIDALKAANAFSLAFDTTPERDEQFALVVRFVTNRGFILHRCLAFRLLAKSMKAGEIVNLIVQLFCVESQLPLNRVRCIARDGATVNTAAMNHLTHTMIPQCVDVICLSHTINWAGKKFTESCDHVDYIIRKWAELGHNSLLLRREFHQRTGEQLKRLPKVRWFGWYEVAAQLHDHWDQVIECLHLENIGSPTLRRNLLQRVEANRADIILEFSLLRDAAYPLVAACYALEGDGFLAPFAFDVLEHIQRIGRECTRNDIPFHENHSLTHLIAAAEGIHDDIGERNEAMRRTAAKARPVYNKLDEDLYHRVGGEFLTFRACRLLQPNFIANNNIGAVTIELEHLASLPHVYVIIESLREELAAYHAVAQNFVLPELFCERPVAAWQFWLQHSLVLPHWFTAAREVALMFTSSASVERVFATYAHLFTDQQGQTLEDRREASVLMRYNRGRGGAL